MTIDRRRKLGRGLSALFGEEGAAEDARQIRMLPIEFLQPGRYQPRRGFDAEQIDALAESIREKGVLQPILARPLDGPDRYEIVAGERRWRAAQKAQLHELPVIVREIGDSDALEIALVENVQRQNLSPLEEAEGYGRLVEEFRYTQETLARTIGKSRSHIANMLRLLGLPDPVRDMLDRGELTAGHARALLTVPDPTGLAREVVARGLNVRQTERLAQGGRGRGGRRAAPQQHTADLAALEREVADLVGFPVSIAWDGAGGALTIRYRSLDEFDALLATLRRAAR